MLKNKKFTARERFYVKSVTKYIHQFLIYGSKASTARAFLTHSHLWSPYFFHFLRMQCYLMLFHAEMKH